MTAILPSSRVAVVDIGSNSVRLVIYEVMRASALPSFNEKVMAGLGRELSQTGRLSPKGVEMALSQLRRFRAILHNLNDEAQTWIMQDDGTYTRLRHGSEEDAFCAHQYFMDNPSLSGRGSALQVNLPPRLAPGEFSTG